MTLTKQQKTTRFVHELAVTVPADPPRPVLGDGPPEKRFLLATIRDRCGHRHVSQVFLADLTDELGDLGLYASPALTSAVDQETWITIQRQPAVPHRVAPSEAALEAFLMASPHSLKGIPRGAELHKEVRVPGMDRWVDILATTPTTVTLIELKQDAGVVGVAQLLGYVDAWMRSADAVGRTVKGILVTGVEDEDTRRAVNNAHAAGHDIEWYVYQLTFSMNKVPA
jgi:hypothetical protein